MAVSKHQLRFTTRYSSQLFEIKHDLPGSSSSSSCCRTRVNAENGLRVGIDEFFDLVLFPPLHLASKQSAQGCTRRHQGGDIVIGE